MFENFKEFFNKRKILILIAVILLLLIIGIIIITINVNNNDNKDKNTASSGEIINNKNEGKEITTKIKETTTKETETTTEETTTVPETESTTQETTTEYIPPETTTQAPTTASVEPSPVPQPEPEPEPVYNPPVPEPEPEPQPAPEPTTAYVPSNPNSWKRDIVKFVYNPDGTGNVRDTIIGNSSYSDDDMFKFLNSLKVIQDDLVKYGAWGVSYGAIRKYIDDFNSKHFDIRDYNFGVIDENWNFLTRYYYDENFNLLPYNN